MSVETISGDDLAPHRDRAPRTAIIRGDKARFHDTYAPMDKDEREAHYARKAAEKALDK